MTQLQYYNWMIVTMEKLAINTTAASTEAVRVQNVVVLITPILFAISLPTKRPKSHMVPIDIRASDNL